ncbi:exported hypothetical protein [Mesorhizobium plurifarium]|uniref:Uncharacterized protein n=1 Tax=Mesorhizobium plurifarium TaxID=69974 RepID=A0A090E0S7_MESPL|nr:exported hypothetical protein [Mesorhizobium plurifarium]
MTCASRTRLSLAGTPIIGAAWTAGIAASMVPARARTDNFIGLSNLCRSRPEERPDWGRFAAAGITLIFGRTYER